VQEKTNKVYYQLLRNFKKLKGVPVVLNTSLNRRGEPMVCSPEDALNMFFGCDLEFMLMEDILVTK
jgi:carbamoyltransferase